MRSGLAGGRISVHFYSFFAWKQHQCTSAWRHRLKPTRRNMFIRNSEGRQWAQAASDWNVVSNQQSFIDQSTDQWQDCFNACLKVKSKHCEHSYDVFFRKCHDFEVVDYCCYEQIDLCFVSQGRVRTAVTRGEQFCCSFVANLLQYRLCANKGSK